MVAPVVAAAAIGAGAGLLGGQMSAKASAREAEKNRQFQEAMSRTAYQRAAEDLEAAGLNRILALGSPASTPPGAMAQIPNFGSVLAEGAGAAVGAMSSAQQVKQSEATIDKLLADTKLTETRRYQELEKTKVWQAIAPIIANAGKDFGTLIDFLKNPSTLRDFMGAANVTITNVGTGVMGTLDEVLTEIYGGNYQGSKLQNVIRTVKGN